MFKEIEQINQKSKNNNSKNNFCPIHLFLRENKNVKILLKNVKIENNRIYNQFYNTIKKDGNISKNENNYENFYIFINFFYEFIENLKSREKSFGKQDNLQNNINKFINYSNYFVEYLNLTIELFKTYFIKEKWQKILNKYFYKNFNLNDFIDIYYSNECDVNLNKLEEFKRLKNYLNNYKNNSKDINKIYLNNYKNLDEKNIEKNNIETENFFLKFLKSIRNFLIHIENKNIKNSLNNYFQIFKTEETYNKKEMKTIFLNQKNFFWKNNFYGKHVSIYSNNSIKLFPDNKDLIKFDFVFKCNIRFKTKKTPEERTKYINSNTFYSNNIFYVFFNKNLFESVFLILWKFLNINLIKLINEEAKKIKKKKKKQFKIGKKEYKFKFTEFDLKTLNQNSRKSHYDIKIFYRFNCLNENRDKKWKIYYKKSDTEKWICFRKYRMGIEWNWSHKGALLGKMFQYYIKKNNCFIFRNTINFEGYNMEQPDFFFISLFFVIFNWKKIDHDDFTKRWWFQNWPKLENLSFSPLSFELKNFENWEINKNKIVEKEYSENMIFRYRKKISKKK